MSEVYIKQIFVLLNTNFETHLGESNNGRQLIARRGSSFPLQRNIVILKAICKAS